MVTSTHYIFSSSIFRLNDNVKEILTPRTLYQKRKVLAKSLAKIRGPVAPIKENLPEKRAKGLGMILDMKEKENLKQSLKPSFLQICKVWIDRAQRLQKIRSQIGGVLELMTKPTCDFCGKNWGLKCETIDNIETVFQKFIRDRNNGNFNEWDLISWQ